MVGFFRIAAALQEQHQRFIPRGLARFRYGAHTGIKIGPDFGPHHTGWFAQRPGMLFAQRLPRIGIVINKDQFWAPSPSTWNSGR